MPSILIGKVLIEYALAWHGYVTVSHHPYERTAWLSRLERNIYVQNEFGVDICRRFDTMAEAEAIILGTINSIVRDYGVQPIYGERGALLAILIGRIRDGRT